RCRRHRLAHPLPRLFRSLPTARRHASLRPPRRVRRPIDLSGTDDAGRRPNPKPFPVSRPLPPIMIGGWGERTLLRLVARYADALNIGVPDPGESRHKLEVLRSHCEVVGRAYGEIEKTALIEVDLRPGHQTVADVIAVIEQQGDEGIEHVIVNMPDAETIRPLESFGREIIP